MQFSIVNYSDLERTKRIDAEFFWPAFLILNQLLLKKSTRSLTELCDVSDGNHMKIASYFQEQAGIPYFRGQDINKDFFLENSNPVFIPENIYEIPYMKRSWFEFGDVLLSIVGTIGSLSLVTERIKKSAGSCKIAILRAKEINSKYIAAFMKTKYGQFQIKRNTRGAVQQGLLLEDMDQIKVYIPEKFFEEKISILIEESILLNRASKTTYKQAQELLLTELGLEDWEPKHRLTFIKNYFETAQAGRIDAEYFQPKYDEIINVIKSYKSGSDTLENCVNLKNSNFIPISAKSYQYIELANISDNGEITDCTVDEGQNLPSRARREVNTGDVIVSSIEGSLSSIALIEEEYNHALCSTGFHTINSERFNSETLLVLLKSLVGQIQLKKGCSGTILTAINQDEFCKIILPNISQIKQQEIQQKVSESFALRKKSKQFLENAKRAIEIAIEQDEQSAITWLKNQ